MAECPITHGTSVCHRLAPDRHVTMKGENRNRAMVGEPVSDHVRPNESVGKRPSPIRRLRASILEMMSLVAALAVAFRWPGLSVPVGLLFLYTLAQRRDILRRQTRVALGQLALALYLPPAAGLLVVGVPMWDFY